MDVSGLIGTLIVVGTIAAYFASKRPKRRIEVENLDDYCYLITLYDVNVREYVKLPCQHLPHVLYWDSLFSRKHAMEITFTAYDLSETRTLIVPPWARRSLMRQLRKFRKTWKPKYSLLPPEGIFR